MKRKLFYLTLFISFPIVLFAQVGINNTLPQAQLDISASNQAIPLNTDGLLIPRIDAFPATNPGANQNSMIVYLTTTVGANTPGFYYWDNTSSTWIGFGNVKQINDLLDGKSDVDGTEDGSSIFLGINSGDTDDGTDNKNVGIGFQSQQLTSTGENNTSIGYNSLRNNTVARNNSAFGYNSLLNNTTGNSNTAIGVQSLTNNITGDSNVAVGILTLQNNVSGTNNVAIGNQSFRSNIYGQNNVALGDYAGRTLDLNNTVASGNDYNVYIGGGAGNSDRNAAQNVYIGFNSGAGDYNLTAGTGTLEDKSGNIFIGYQSGYNESNSNRLYIENSNADADNALIYGEFDNDVLRTNSEFQIGNPTTTGYAFPTTDGTANQILTTDGNGQLSFQNNTNSYSLVRATLSADQTLVSGTQKLAFSSIDFDLNNEFDTTNNEFVANNDGYYKIEALFSTDNQSNTTSYTLLIYINGTIYQRVQENHSGNGRVTRQISAIANLAANDTVHIEVETTGTGAGTSILSNNTRTMLSIQQIK